MHVKFLIMIVFSLALSAVTYTLIRYLTGSRAKIMGIITQAKVTGKGSFLDLCPDKRYCYLDIEFKTPDNNIVTAQYQYAPSKECILEIGDYVAIRHIKKKKEYMIEIIDFSDYIARKSNSHQNKKGCNKSNGQKR